MHSAFRFLIVFVLLLAVAPASHGQKDNDLFDFPFNEIPDAVLTESAQKSSEAGAADRKAKLAVHFSNPFWREDVRDDARKAAPIAIQEVRTAFKHFANSRKDLKTDKAIDLVDIVYMAERMIELGVAPAEAYRDASPLRFKLVFQQRDRIRVLISSLGWDRFEILRIHTNEAGNEATLYARHWDDEDSRIIEWSLAKRDNIWRVFDFRSLEHGIPMSCVLAGVLDAARVDIGLLPTRLHSHYYSLADCQEMAKKARPHRSRTPRKTGVYIDLGVRPSSPSPTLAIAFCETGRFDNALAVMHRSLRVNQRNPDVQAVAATIYNAVADHKSALDSCKKYAELVSATSQIYYEAGVAYRELGHLDLAKEAFEKGYVDDPGIAENILGMMTVDWPERRETIIERFSKCIILDEEMELYAQRFVNRKQFVYLKRLIDVQQQTALDGEEDLMKDYRQFLPE